MPDKRDAVGRSQRAAHGSMTPPVCNRNGRPARCQPARTNRRELTQVAIDARGRSSPVWRTVAARLLLEHGAKVLDARHGCGWAGGANAVLSFFFSSFSFLPCTRAEAIRKRAGADQPVSVWKVCTGRHRGEEKQQEQIALDELLGHIPQGQFSRAGKGGWWCRVLAGRWEGCDGGKCRGRSGSAIRLGRARLDSRPRSRVVSFMALDPGITLHRVNQVGGNSSSSQVVRHTRQPGVGEASAATPILGRVV